MSNIVALKKIYDLRNDEKNRALLDQKCAEDQFEKIAKQLYSELKTKEMAQSSLDKMYKQSQIILRIREQTLYIESLNEKINILQREVQEARNNMEEKQLVVTETYLELKKVEKIIEKREQKFKSDTLLKEMKQMDEISLNQYIRAK